MGRQLASAYRAGVDADRGLVAPDNVYRLLFAADSRNRNGLRGAARHIRLGTLFGAISEVDTGAPNPTAYHLCRCSGRRVTVA